MGRLNITLCATTAAGLAALAALTPSAYAADETAPTARTGPAAHAAPVATFAPAFPAAPEFPATAVFPPALGFAAAPAHPARPAAPEVPAAPRPAAPVAPAVPASTAAGREVIVTPSSPAAGDDVTLTVRGCSARTGKAVSSAFVADVHLAGADGGLTGETKVRSTLEPGPYDVKITCGEYTIKGSITVVAATDGPHPTTPASPIAPVPAGGGGMAPLVMSSSRSDGPGTAQAITGLVLAGVAAVAVALRSARRSRRTD
ncbi:hypothetical protein ACFQE4_11050 [Streptomyces thermocoprophilus]|uniref:Uncharacterized protein n=1 Tax=Streptomyces thermocoprophilus TaxID=78356 RepID=A0ABV5V9E8_9ACTN